MSDDVYATYKAAQAMVRRGGMTDEEGLLFMARTMLEGLGGEQTEPCSEGGATDEKTGHFPIPAVAKPSSDAPVEEQATAMARVTMDLPVPRPLAGPRKRGDCYVPSCHARGFRGVHHSWGPQASDTIIMCFRHHVAAARGWIKVTGSTTGGWVFRLADGSVEVCPGNTVWIDVCEVLQKIGITEKQARWMVDRARDQVGPDIAPPDALIAALRRWPDASLL